ncbi:MAG: protein-disulfide reductase DsbD [Epsilonproteobacteria bacterium]|nr:protein-disulfide reductase DsbD [Campylobacterota bacterium]
MAFGGFPKFLEPEEAFKPSVKVDSQSAIIATVELGKDIYIYKDKTEFKILSPDGIKIKKILYPATKMHDEDVVFEGTPKFKIILENLKALQGVQDVELKFSFQGCSARGICYEPIENVYKLKIDTSKIFSSIQKEQTPKNANASAEVSEVDTIASTLKEGNFFLVVATFFGFGLLLALTPCVFPMIPIISGLIISQGKGMTTKKAFFLSVVYVLAMAFAYTIAGVLAGLFGSNLQAALQDPYVVVAFSAIFVALALSMFGYYELKLPSSLVTKVSSIGQDKGGVIGVAIMGFLSALIVGPCVAAPLAGALVYIGQSGDALLGAVALFAMSIGMGVPLIIVGTGAGKFMPRPGEWMILVNGIFGIMMLGVAIWMLDKIVAPEVTMFLSAVLLLATGLFLGVFDNKGHVLKRTFAWIFFIYALALFIGMLSGSTSFTTPLKGLHVNSQTTQNTTTKELAFKVVKNLDQLDLLLEANKGKKIMIDFSAKWCTSCKELEEITFKDPNVQKLLSKFVLIRADVTQNSDAQKEMSKKYGVFGPPVMLFIDQDGKLLRSKTIVGFVEPREFIRRVEGI